MIWYFIKSKHKNKQHSVCVYLFVTLSLWAYFCFIFPQEHVCKYCHKHFDNHRLMKRHVYQCKIKVRKLSSSPWWRSSSSSSPSSQTRPNFIQEPLPMDPVDCGLDCGLLYYMDPLVLNVFYFLSLMWLMADGWWLMADGCVGWGQMWLCSCSWAKLNCPA